MVLKIVTISPDTMSAPSFVKSVILFLSNAENEIAQDANISHEFQDTFTNTLVNLFPDFSTIRAF